MSERRPSPAGLRVSAGRLRVDAARAVDKLRDYQLPDPIMWVLEVVRAAVLARAESIRVYGDADDVAIAWDGEPIDPEDLARLLDELVDPAPAADRRHLRLLATGVNTALGLSPRWIDVVSCDGTGEAHAVRYTTRLLERKGESGAAGLRELRAERRGAVPHAPARGVLVHLRRPPLLSAVPILIGLGEPAELSMLRRAAVDLSVPLSIGRSVLGRDRSHVDLLRIELGEGLDGFLALTDPTFAEDEASLDVAELGVLLARYTLPLLPGGAKPRARVPLRLFVDAERMPTNASRSAVRLDDPPVCDVVARAPALLSALTARLAAELKAPAHPWTPAQSERLRAAALSLLAIAVAGPTWREDLVAIAATAYGEALAKLASLPLLRDALGRPRAPSSFALRSGAMHVHFGADPFPSALEPWLGDVLWVPPGDPSVVLLGGWRAPPAQELAARARELERARALWLREKPRPATLEDDPLHLLVVPIRRPGDSLKSCVSGLFGSSGSGEPSGQLALCDPRGTRASRVTLLIEGREIESLSLELPVPIVAVVEHAGLRPSADYRSAERDEAFDAALAAVRAAAVVACEALALRMRGKSAKGDRAAVRAPWLASTDPSERAIVTELVRGGVMLALSLPGASLEKSRSPLLTADVWSLATGEGKCLRDIFAAIGAAPRVLRWSRARSAHPPPPGARPVFALSPAEQAAIAAVAKPSTTVDYTSLVAGWAPPALSAMQGGAACRVGTEDEAVIGWGALRGKILVRHWGRRVAEIALSSPELSACQVQVEDGALVPGEDGKGTRGDAPGPYPLAAWHRQLATAYIDALAGSPPPELTVFADDPRAATFARAGLLEAIASATLDPIPWLGTDRVETLRRVPWVRALGEPEPISLDVLSARFPEGAIPYVPPETIVPRGLDWHPARATSTEARAFERLLERELAPAVDQVIERVRRARRKEALEKLRRRPVVRHSDGWSGPRIALKGAHVVSAVCALGPGDRAQVDVRLEGRPFASLTLETELPVRLDVDFEESAADEDLHALGLEARATLTSLAVRGARRLLRQIAQQDPSSLTMSPGVLALLGAWSKTIGGLSAESKLADELLAAPAFASIQGGPLVALEAAKDASSALRVASWDEPWLGPAEGERPSAYDAPIVRLTSSVDRPLLSALYRGRLRDVTGAAGKLQTERRIARGLVKLARLEGVKDPRFRYPLAELLEEADEASELLGFGEAALDDAPRTVVTLFAAGVQRKVLDLALVPAVRVAAESPLVRSGQPLSAELEGKLADAVRVVIARLVRKVVDTTPPDQLPEWVRHTLRASCLSGGALHFERLDVTPMFKTTAGAWLTPAELRAQHESLGPIWWTAAALPLVPLDPARVALQLRRGEAEQLAQWLPCMDAQAELELDAKARANRDRAPVESLEPTEAERASALAVIELDAQADDPSRGVIVVLRPGHEGRRGMRMHRAMRPMGILPDPCAWPALARLDDPELVPNRTWSEPEEGVRLAALRSRVSEAVRKELIRRVPYPRGMRYARRISNARVLGLAGKASVEAVVWLEESLGAGTLAVCDRRGERTITPVAPLRDGMPTPAEDQDEAAAAGRRRHAVISLRSSIEPSHEGRPLPVSGTVWMASAPVDGAVTKAIYRFLLEQVARDVPSAPEPDDLATAHLLHGLGLGLVERRWLPPAALPCFVPVPWALDELAAALDRGERVPVAAPADRGALLASEVPVLVDDGSPVARALIVMLGARAYSWRPALRASVPEAPAPMPGGAADPQPAASPRSALERRLEERLASLSPQARVKIASRRKKPLLATEDGTLVLAGAHPIAVRLRVLAETDDPRLELALTLLAARVAGHQHRVAARIGKSGELEAMLRLLGP